MKKTILLCAALLALLGCKKDNGPPPKQVKVKMEIPKGMPGAPK